MNLMHERGQMWEGDGQGMVHDIDPKWPNCHPHKFHRQGLSGFFKKVSHGFTMFHIVSLCLVSCFFDSIEG